jgi:hypothetical protein
MERVVLDRVSAGYGGTRIYFRCPGPGCGRRVMALYLVDGLFRCQPCHGEGGEVERKLSELEAAVSQSQNGVVHFRPKVA